MGEIALAIVRSQLIKDGIPGKRRLGQISADLKRDHGIPATEVKEFYMQQVSFTFGRVYQFEDVRIRGRSSQ